MWEKNGKSWGRGRESIIKHQGFGSEVASQTSLSSLP